MGQSEFHDSIAGMVNTSDPSTLSDEMLLAKILPQGSIETRILLAKALIERFRSFGLVLNANTEQLMGVPGIEVEAVNSIKFHQATANRLVSSFPSETIHLMDADNLVAYLGPLLCNKPIEYFYTLYLDSSGCLILGEETSKGTLSRATVYPREIVKRALELHTKMVVIAHNHPSGDPNPSVSDIDSTRDIAMALSTVDIRLLDHIIVGHEFNFCFSSSEYKTALSAKATGH